MNKDSKQKSIEELETKNAEIHLDIVPVCCFFLILVIFGMCMLKDIAKETEKKSLASVLKPKHFLKMTN